MSVLYQRGNADVLSLIGTDSIELSPLAQQRDRAAREVIRAQRVLEARMRRAGIDQVSKAELSHIAQALEVAGVHELHRERVNPDVVPEGVANDLEVHGAKVRRTSALRGAPVRRSA